MYSDSSIIFAIYTSLIFVLLYIRLLQSFYCSVMYFAKQYFDVIIMHLLEVRTWNYIAFVFIILVHYSLLQPQVLN